MLAAPYTFTGLPFVDGEVASEVRASDLRSLLASALLSRPARTASLTDCRATSSRAAPRTGASSAPSLAKARTPWLPLADSGPQHEPPDVHARISPPGTSLRCSMNHASKETAHEIRIRRMAYFYSAAEHRSRGALWPSFAPALNAGTVFGLSFSQDVPWLEIRCRVAACDIPSDGKSENLRCRLVDTFSNVPCIPLLDRDHELSDISRRHRIDGLVSIRGETSASIRRIVVSACRGDLPINHHFHHSRATFSKLFSASRCRASISFCLASPSALRSAIGSVPASMLLRAAR